MHVRARMRDDHTRDLRAVGLALPATPLPGPEHNQDERKDKQRKLDYSVPTVWGDTKKAFDEIYIHLPSQG